MFYKYIKRNRNKNKKNNFKKKKNFFFYLDHKYLYKILKF